MTGTGLRFVLLVGLAVMGVGLLGTRTAIAQYPEPVGNITLTPEESAPDVGSSVQVEVKLVNAAGDDLSGAACTASIARQPGSDAAVSPSQFTSGASGDAELTVETGSTSGDVHVTVECDPRSANVVLTVGGEEAASGSGQDDDDDGGSSAVLWIVVAAVVALAVLASIVWLLRSRRAQNPA